METLLLKRHELEEVISMPEVVESVERTFRGMGEGTVINPTKVHLDLGDGPSGLPFMAGMNAMPAYVGWQQTAGLKWVGGWENNPKQGLPYINGLVLLVDPNNGHFLAAMDGMLVTNLRTGAQAAVALKYLLNDVKHPTIGLYGAGAQGRTQVLAISSVFDVQAYQVYDISEEALQRFSDEMGDKVKAPIHKASSPEEAAEGADVLVSVTHARNKFITNDFVKEGMTVCPMGSFRECADDLVLSVDKIIVDHIDQCLHRGALKEVSESGRLGSEDIYATLGEVVTGTKKGRESPGERIMCIPIGTGAMDVAVASLAYQKALERGMGTRYSFFE
ncbi:MAG: ornithine cyclodeaminase family protein [Synergistales bacterium]|nr:ornithine cyclodeaminase family protein [Synergistales bacterium]